MPASQYQVAYHAAYLLRAVACPQSCLPALWSRVSSLSLAVAAAAVPTLEGSYKPAQRPHPQWSQDSFLGFLRHQTTNASGKSTRGELPTTGPAQERLRALPFTTSPEAAKAAFQAYHKQQQQQGSADTSVPASQSKWLGWLYSRQAPLLRKPLKEAYLPFWVGQAEVDVALYGAEVGKDRLVTRYDRRTGRSQPTWETEWMRVRVDARWRSTYRAEQPDMQLYASWKYNRADIEALRPGPLITLAQKITPDMLQASPAAASSSRRVGPFTLTPDTARRLLAAQIKSQELSRAEEQLKQLTGATHVRLVQMDLTYASSSGHSSSSGSTSGPLLSPVYMPAYVFSWMHGGAKVRTFVSGVNPAQLAGTRVLNDQLVATLAAGAAAGALVLMGVSGLGLLWGGLIVPFVLGGLSARFWPLLRQGWGGAASQLHRTWHQGDIAGGGGGSGAAGTVWDADFVRAYSQYERERRRAEQQEQARSTGGSGGGAPGGPWAQGFSAQDFEDLFRDPFSWFERQFARQQQQQHKGSAGGARGGPGAGSRSTGGQYRSRTAGGFTDAHTGPPGDPQGFYQRLGVKPTATPQEVQAAFRGLALQHHPDRYSSPADKAAATKRFQALTEAYQVLRDVRKRRQYDEGVYRA